MQRLTDKRIIRRRQLTTAAITYPSQLSSRTIIRRRRINNWLYVHISCLVKLGLIDIRSWAPKRVIFLDHVSFFEILIILFLFIVSNNSWIGMTVSLVSLIIPTFNISTANTSNVLPVCVVQLLSWNQWVPSALIYDLYIQRWNLIARRRFIVNIWIWNFDSLFWWNHQISDLKFLITRFLRIICDHKL